MDDLLLTRATLFASTNPCSLSRRDMLEFVRLAGFDGTSPIMQAVAAEPDGLIKLAEKRASVPAGNALRQPWTDRRQRMVLPDLGVAKG